MTMTVPEMVELVFDRGGNLWTVDGDNPDAEIVIRHKGAPKVIIQALRSVPVMDVIAALEERQQKSQTARGWFFENVMPVMAAETSIECLLRDYQEYCKARNQREAIRHARQTLSVHEIPGGMVNGFMLVVDFVELVRQQGRTNQSRFMVGDIVRNINYSSYPRLTVLEIRGADLLVARTCPASSSILSTVFRVAAIDCEWSKRLKYIVQ